MATVRLRNPKGTFSLKGLNPEVRQRIRETLHTQPQENLKEDATLSDLQPSKSKWHNIRTTVDGITFDSKREAKHYAELKIELRTGEITDLELQKPFRLDTNGFHICDYVADFVYRRAGALIVSDAKGKPTELYLMKKALMCAIHGIEIVEV